MQTALLIIDPQIDFCDSRTGSLYINGAESDISRLSAMIRRHSQQIDRIFVTLDSHHYVNVAHPIYWLDREGNHPAPFTLISAVDVENGIWQATETSFRSRSLEYVRQLEKSGKYSLCIWPYHCLIGSLGQSVMPELFEALQFWEQRFAVVEYIQKGMNLHTEHYSAIQAEVPDREDPTTQINTTLIETLRQAEIVLIAGEAGSHCVANTVRDMVYQFGNERDIAKLTLLTDTISPVAGFEKLQIDFFEDMKALGVNLSTTLNALS